MTEAMDIQTSDPQELVPLEAGTRKPNTKAKFVVSTRSCYRTPLRLCRLIALLIVLPTLFIMIPLYMRYRVFLGQMYPMSMTDMRLIDSKISPTWCQRQVVRSNTSFNAFVVPGPPTLSEDLVPVTMTRELELEDDMKEYWGFYLLKGSSVTVSTCVSYPGASLIMIKGYRHLQDCAYIGDDSSEEVEEVVEAYNLGLISNTTFMEKIKELRLKKVDGKANDPGAMRRHKAGVSFHDPNTVANMTSSDNFPANVDVTDQDPKELKEILERLHALRQAAKTESLKYYHPPKHLVSLPALHRHRDANVDVDERRFLSFKDIEGNNGESTKENTQKQIISDNIVEVNINNTLPITTTSTNIKINKINTDVETNRTDIQFNENTNVMNEGIHDINITETTKTNTSMEIISQELANNTEFDFNSDTNNQKENTEIEKIQENPEETTLQEMNTEYTTTAEPNSKEVFEDVLQRLQSLGDKGKRVLIKLHETMGIHYNEQMPSKTLSSSVTGSSEELDHLRRVLIEAIDEEKTRSQREKKRRELMIEGRAKRELMLGHIELTKELNQDDEARDYAAEEGLEPDGYAEHHSTVNETTALDMSNSEFWSSFSSSEEALLECDGLILNLPLTPHKHCQRGVGGEDAVNAARANALTYRHEFWSSFSRREEALLECDGLILNLPLTPHKHCQRGVGGDDAVNAARANALTYRVPANGYYFFVFNSENEVQKNFIRAKFDLQKTRYDVARTKLRECNATDNCHLPLDIFSTQKVVLEVPLRDNDSLWNEQFVIISECEPRTSVYLFCVVAVPVLFMVFAFQ